MTRPDRPPGIGKTRLCAAALAALLCAGVASVYAFTSSDKNIGQCFRHDYSQNSVVTECFYVRVPGALISSTLADDLRIAAGVSMRLGPWADEEDDIIRPSLLALAGNRPIGLNFTMRGGMIYLSTAQSGFFNNLFIEGSGEKEKAAKQ